MMHKGEAIMDFVDKQGYTEVIHFVSRMAAIQTFLTNKANLDSPTKKGRKNKPHVIPYCRFTKLIICHLGRIHNIHQRSASSFHLVEEDFRLGNLKFISKGEADEHDQKVATKKEGKMKTTSAKQPKSKPAIEKSSKPALHQSRRQPRKDLLRPPLLSHPSRSLQKKSQPRPHHHNKPARAQSQANVGGVSIREPISEATQPLPIVEGKGKAIVTEEQAAHSQLALYTPKRRSTIDQFIFQRQTPAIEVSSSRPFVQAQDDTSSNIVRDSPSLVDAEIGAASEKTNSGGDTEILQINEEQVKDVDNQVNLEEKTYELDQGQVGSDPGRTLES
uniref:Uncharacterized protein n=1 Tax=Tanacetum cinerariifolium TaxID=118510 RepID=A0A699HQN8_TANCI|nr:hypothetical protein [Tanacetum cinerariifolium]